MLLNWHEWRTLLFLFLDFHVWKKSDTTTTKNHPSTAKIHPSAIKNPTPSTLTGHTPSSPAFSAHQSSECLARETDAGE